MQSHPTPSRSIINSSNACNQASAHIVYTPLHGPVQFDSQFIGLLGLSGTCFPKISPSPLRIVTPRITLFLWPSPLIIANGISIGSALFVWVPNVMPYNALSVGKKAPKLPLPLGISSRCQRRTEPQPYATSTKNW